MPKPGIFTDSPSHLISESSRVETIWKENASKIYKLCSARSSDREAAEDLFQDVALKFCRSASTMNLMEPMYPWFSAVIRNSHFDQFRRRGNVTVMSSLSKDAMERSVLPRISIRFQDDYREILVDQELRFLMSDLSSFEKFLVNCSLIGGETLVSISQQTGLSKNMMSKRRLLALSKMRKKKKDRDERLEKGDAPPVLLEDLLTRAG